MKKNYGFVKTVCGLNELKALSLVKFGFRGLEHFREVTEKNVFAKTFR